MNKQTQINGVLSPLLQKLRFKKILPYIKGNDILDIGCSTGEILHYLPDSINYTGIEGNLFYFKHAQKLNPNYKFLNLYIDANTSANLDLTQKDTIIMLAILEHLNEPLKVLKNLRKYLSKGGRIIITTPSNYSKYILKIGSKLSIFTKEISEHKNHFSKKEILLLVKNSGAKIIHYSRFELGMNHLIVLE